MLLSKNLPTETDLETLIRKDAKGKRIVPKQWYKIENVFEDELLKYPTKIQEMYEYDEESRTYKIPEYIWLDWRAHAPNGATPVCIGGSAIGVLYDGSELSKVLYLYEGQHGSKYQSNIEYWYEKVGEVLPLKEKKDDEVLWVGHNEEPSIRNAFKKIFCQDHPEAIVEVINDTHMYQSKVVPCCLCDFDGLVVIDGIEGILECKTCQFSSEDYILWKQGIVPLKYYLQVCWYMLCKNVPYAYVVCKTGISLTDFVYIYVERNFEIEDMIIEMANKFCDCVVNRVEPDISGSDIERLNIFWRRKMGNINPKAPMVQLDESLKDVFIDINTIDVEVAQLQERINEIQAHKKALLVKHIFPVFGDSTFGIINISDTECFKVKLKNSKARQTKFDTAKLKEEHPDLYSKYLTKKESFNTTLFKKEQKLLVEQYTIPDDTLTEAKENFCEITVEERKFIPKPEVTQQEQEETQKGA